MWARTGITPACGAGHLAVGACETGVKADATDERPHYYDETGTKKYRDEEL